MINVADNFNYQGAKPLDSRLQFSTIADMKAYAESSLYNGCFAYVTATQKYYSFDSNNTVDADTGRWREFEGGGGGVDNAVEQYEELPEITAEMVGKVVQYVGETDEDYIHNYFYEAVSDGEATPTYSWERTDVQPSGGSGSGALEDALTTSVTVGGIASGTTYPKDTKLEKLFRDMLNPVAYPTLTNPSATMAATGAKLLETGATLNTTFTITFSRGSINPAYGTSGYRSGAADEYTLDGVTQSGNTFSKTITSAKTSYQGSVLYLAGEQPKDSIGEDYQSPLPAGSVNTNTITYEFVDALWANVANIATIAKQSLVSKSAKQKDFAFPAQTVANPEVFDVPASWTVTAVQVKNDLSGAYEDALSQFTVTDTSHNDAAGNSVAYKRYTFNLGYDTGARSVRLKWS